MSNQRQETIADIVTEMRKRAEEVYVGQSGYPESWKDQMDYGEIYELADRIEAAHKREHEATIEKSSVVGNAAVMLDALDKILWCLEWMSDNTENKSIKDHLAKPIELAKSALSASPRNCDVGTADEQAKLFHSFCEKFQSCIQEMCSPLCPFINCCDVCHCMTKWLQMPYKEGEK